MTAVTARQREGILKTQTMAKQIKKIDKLEDRTPDGNNFNRHTECEAQKERKQNNGNE